MANILHMLIIVVLWKLEDWWFTVTGQYFQGLWSLERCGWRWKLGQEKGTYIFTWVQGSNPEEILHMTHSLGKLIVLNFVFVICEAYILMGPWSQVDLHGCQWWILTSPVDEFYNTLHICWWSNTYRPQWAWRAYWLWSIASTGNGTHRHTLQ